MTDRVVVVLAPWRFDLALELGAGCERHVCACGAPLLASPQTVRAMAAAAQRTTVTPSCLGCAVAAGLPAEVRQVPGADEELRAAGLTALADSDRESLRRLQARVAGANRLN